MFNFIKKIVRKVTDKTIKFQTQLLDFLKSFFKTTKEDAPKEETQTEESTSTSTDESSKLGDLVAANDCLHHYAVRGSRTAEARERAKALDPHSTRQKESKEETQTEKSASTSTDESSKLGDLVAAKTAEAGERAKAFDPHSTRQKARKTKPLRKANRKPRK